MRGFPVSLLIQLSLLSWFDFYYTLFLKAGKVEYTSRRMQCIVGSLYAVYTTAIFGIVERVQNYVR